MKIPLSWISLYSPIESLYQNYSIKELAHNYSIHTAEIDGIDVCGLEKVVVGKVLSCEKHPESKKLSIVRVLLGEHGEETILTGAPNIIDATYIAVAMVGAVLPGDFIIGERMMAGMMSRGMICGADEIGLSTEPSTGIMILEEEWDESLLESMLGKSFFDLTLPFPGHKGQAHHYTLRDTVFEIDNKFITNRPDLFSVVGNAREFHTVFRTPLTPYEESTWNHTETLPIAIETPKVRAMHFVKTSNLSVADSPFSIRLMMERAGQSPKMDIVDITNLIMTELGQPMHAFDADKIHGTLRVRMAQIGEKLLALNGQEFTLTEEDIVIADDNGPLSLAGIIGGMSSAVSADTTNVIWESGNFDPTTIRLSAQRHGVRTDASTRFEKSLDPLQAGKVFPRVFEYLNFLGKSYQIQEASTYIDAAQIQERCLSIRADFISKKAGVQISEESIIETLSRLGCHIKKDGEILHVDIPSWRATKDLTIAEDLAEEVIRVYGYENIELQSLPVGKGIVAKNTDITLRNLSLEHLRSSAWQEVYTYSFTNEKLDSRILLGNIDEAIKIRNAFNEEYTHMRRSLAPRLFLGIEENLKYSKNLRFFEIGKIYKKQESTDLWTQ
jgi:phenylalanyl-tRNA synthetase beta chain